MDTSAWFDYNVYMTNKLAEVTKADPAYGWDMPKLITAFTAAGYVDKIGAEKHFIEHGQYEDVAPNAFFNATEYYRFKAAEFYKTTPKAVTDVEAAFMQVAIKNAGMSAWSHYEQFGNTEGVNPSNSFNTAAYMQAKVDALNLAAVDGKTWTVPLLNEAFKAAGLSALEHFMIYAGNSESGEVTQGLVGGKIPPEFAVSEENKVNPGNPGKTTSLTTEIDNLPGTAGDDVFTSGVVGTDPTLNPGDKIDGGAGNDTLRLYGVGAGSANFTTADIKSVENVELLGGGSGSATADILDTSKNADVRNVIVGTGEFSTASVGIKMSLSQNLVLKGDVTTANNSGMSITYDGADKGTADSVSLTLDNLTMMESGGSGNNATLTINGVENITMNLTGDNAFGGASGAENLVADKLEVLTLKGTGTLSMGIASGNAALKTINASNAGGVDFVFEDLSDNAAFTTFTGSANDDKITIASGAISGGMTFTGGSGDDTLKLKNAVTDAATVKGVTGFEIYEHGFSGSQDVSLFAEAGQFNEYVISGNLAGGSGLTKVSGPAQQNIRFIEDQTSGLISLKNAETSLVKQNVKLVLDDITAGSSGGLDITAFNVSGAGTIEIENLSATVHDNTAAYATDGNSVSGFLAAAAHTIKVTGNDSLQLNIAAGTNKLALIDASELGKDITTGTKPGLHLTVADDTAKTDLSIIGTAGNDFITLTEGSGSGDIFTYVYNGGDDAIALAAVASGSLGIEFDDAAKLGADSSLTGGSLLLGSGFTVASGGIVATGAATITLSDDLAGSLVRGGAKLDIADITATASSSGWDSLTSDKFAAGDNFAIVAGNSGGFKIYFDINSDGAYNAADDYVIDIVGTGASGRSTLAYETDTNAFTFTGVTNS